MQTYYCFEICTEESDGNVYHFYATDNEAKRDEELSLRLAYLDDCVKRYAIGQCQAGSLAWWSKRWLVPQKAVT